MRKKKNSLILGMILLVLALGIGYAAISTTLNISGTTDVDSNTWNVYFDNVQVMSGSVAAEPPEIDTSLTTVSFSVHFTEPGQFYEFMVDAKNDGSIDAMIESVVKTVNGNTTIPNYLKYTVTYEDDVEIRENHLLASNTQETYKVRLEYRDDIDPNDLPETDQSLAVVFGTPFIQADSGAEEVRKVVYFGSDWDENHRFNRRVLYTPATSDDGYFDTPEEAKAALYSIFGTDKMYIKAVIKDGIYAEGYVIFTITDEMEQAHPEMHAGTYTLTAGGATLHPTNGQYDINSIYYEDNKDIVMSAFDSSICHSYNTEGENPFDWYYYCEIANVINVSINRNGGIWVSDKSLPGLISCVIDEWGSDPGELIITCADYDY